MGQCPREWGPPQAWPQGCFMGFQKKEIPASWQGWHAACVGSARPLGAEGAGDTHLRRDGDVREGRQGAVPHTGAEGHKDRAAHAGNGNEPEHLQGACADALPLPPGNRIRTGDAA